MSKEIIILANDETTFMKAAAERIRRICRAKGHEVEVRTCEEPTTIVESLRSLHSGEQLLGIIADDCFCGAWLHGSDIRKMLQKGAEQALYDSCGSPPFVIVTGASNPPFEFDEVHNFSPIDFIGDNAPLKKTIEKWCDRADGRTGGEGERFL